MRKAAPERDEVKLVPAYRKVGRIKNYGQKVASSFEL